MGTNKGFFGHPVGLFPLFLTEMWERFSYYGMRALLVLYLVQYQQWQPSQASGVYKWYTSLVYLAPLLGGFLADRYLGLRVSIIAGATLMAIGHFLMAFEPLPFFYTALGFLIAGNGFFKPNISTLVGKMYKPDDVRRDGAFTIFYMGINLGAFLSPLVCGWLASRFGFHYGFGAAGVGMLIGLVTFLIGQKHMLRAVQDAGNELHTEPGKQTVEVVKEEPSEREPGAAGISGLVSKVFPFLMIATAVAVPALFIYKLTQGEISFTGLIMPVLFAAISGWMGVTLLTLKGAGKDKSTVIFVLFGFVVLFWMGFEQAGNALNLWAEFNTRRFVASYEYPAAWFQSVNAAFIVIFAPLFAVTWVALAKRGKAISTPMKMFAAMVFMVLSFGAMVAGAAAESQVVTSVKLDSLPDTVKLEKIFAGRIQYNAATQQLDVRGALPAFAVTEALTPTVDANYVASIDALETEVKYATKDQPKSVKLQALPADFELPKIENVKSFNRETGELTLTKELDPVQKSRLVGAGAPAGWRVALNTLSEKSDAARVSAIWLLLSYLFATLGELCLSPVGLSMVTKLAPHRFASLFMGVWLLATSVAQYVGGSLGEDWGRVAPVDYFTLFVITSLVGAGILALLIRPLRKLMHAVT
ncbi:MAG: peptide MFS transporter [Myxococcaceae bacterium]